MKADTHTTTCRLSVGEEAKLLKEFLNYCCSRWNVFERCSQFVLSFLFFEVAVGVGGRDTLLVTTEP